jgi:hypothetical protein
MVIVTHSIAEYIKKNQQRKHARWKIADGEWSFEMVSGVWAGQELFDDVYPVYEYQKFNDKGTNPDGTKIK